MKISHKKWSMGVLISLIFFALGMIYFTQNIKQQMNTTFISGPRFYPILLAGLLIIFCVLSIFFTLKKPDKTIEFLHIQRPLITLGIIVVWAVLWTLWGYFYPVSTVAIFIMTVYLNPEPMSHKKILRAIVLAVIIMGCIYLLFTLLLNVKF